MPAPVSTCLTPVMIAGLSNDREENEPKITIDSTTGKMGKRKVVPSGPSQLTTGLMGTEQKNISLDQRSASSIHAPVGLSLTDQSNLAALSNMEPLKICQGILSIEGFDELKALSQLLVNTRHRDNTEISKIMTYQLTQLENQADH